MTLKGGTIQACASCKYQRRKCTRECPLAPYFPPDQPKMFQNAHKLFGVSNILKILKDLDVSLHGEAMRSIICQANIRDRYPVQGCCAVIQDLFIQIQLVEDELNLVHAHLDRLRNQQFQISSVGPSQLDLGMAPPNLIFNNNNINQDQPNYINNVAFPIAQQHSYSVSSSVGCNNSVPPAYLDSSKDNEANSLWYATNDNTHSMVIQSQDYDEIQPFFDVIDDRQSYIIFKEAYESSSEASLKDMTQSTEHVAENELKNAAACFSLTSVN